MAAENHHILMAVCDEHALAERTCQKWFEWFKSGDFGLEYEERPRLIPALYPWWDHKGVLYYELLKPGETINKECYRQQLIKIKWAIAKKRQDFVTRHEPKIFHHDNARPYVARPVRNYLENSDCEVLSHGPYCPDIPTCSGWCSMPSLKYGWHQNRVSKIGLIHSWPSSGSSYFGMESTYCQYIVIDPSLIV